MKKYLVTFMTVFCLALSGCGYTTTALLPKYKTIHVENFKNKIDPTSEISDRRSNYTYTPGLETEITKAVIDRFVFDRHLEIDSQENATLLLKGALVDITHQPLSYNKNDDVEEYRIELYVDVELYDNKTGELLWKESRFMGQTDYSVIGPNARTETQAQQDAVADLAQRIAERTIENW